MTLEELLKRTGGQTPQYASYGDIVSGIQSQYNPQTEFAPTQSLLDIIGTQLPEQQRIAYGSLLQAKPKTAITPINLSGDKVINSSIDALASADTAGLSNPSILSTDALNRLSDIASATDFTNTGGTSTSGGLFGTGVNTSDITKATSVVGPIAALAGDSDLAKTALALNLISSAADIKTEEDVLNLGAKIAMLAAGPQGNALAAGLGLATNNTPMTINALLSAANPVLGLVNTIAGNLTDYNIGSVVNGLLNAPEGAIDQYGLLGASNVGNLIANQGTNATRQTYTPEQINQRTLEILASLGDTDASAKLLNQSGARTGFDLMGGYSTDAINALMDYFTPSADSLNIQDQTSGKALR
jgi:hypothetical protein